MELKMTEIQKAYLLGREPKYGGKTGTQCYLELELDIDIEKYEKSLNYIIQQQPMLRARIMEGSTFQIEEELVYKIPINDDCTEDLQTYIQRRRNELSHKIFNKEDYPLFSIEVKKIDENKYYLFFNIDLMIADGQSAMILSNQIKNHYLKGETIENQLKPLIIAHEKYFENRESSQFLKSREFWNLKKMEGIKRAELSIDELNFSKGTFSRKEFSLSQTEYQKLKKIEKEHKINLSALLLFLYNSCISKFSESKEFYTNVTLSLRSPNPMFGKLIYDYTSSTLISNIAGENLKDSISATSMELFRAMRNRYFEGVDIIRMIQNEQGFYAMPYIFTSMLFDEKLFEDDFYKVKFMLSQTSQLYLDNQVKIVNGSLNITWDYASEVFQDEVINAMFTTYKDMILYIVNNGLEKNMDEYFNTERLALVDGDENRENIENVSEILDKIPEKIFNMSKELYMFEGFSVDSEKLKAKVEYFKNTIVSMKEKDTEKNQKIRVALTNKKTVNNLALILALIILKDSFTILNLEGSNAELIQDVEFDYFYDDNEQFTKGFTTNCPKEEAYVLFTSGSTGKPKGVSISYEGMLNTCQDIIERYNVSRQDIIANISKWSFDLSIFDIIAPLICECTTNFIHDISHYHNYDLITIWNSTPKIYEYLLEKFSGNLVDLRLVLLSGDVISYSLYKKHDNKLNSVQLISLGGATEVSIWSVYYDITKGTDISYGFPLLNQKISVRDDKGKILSKSEVGELWIGGAGVALGYVNSSNDSFVVENGERWYKTGDKVSFEDKRGLQFLGRISENNKLNGYRIDLKLIENKMSEVFIKNLFFVDIYKNDKSDVLYSVYSGPILEKREIQKKISPFLQRHMIPKHFINVQELPLNGSGKIDKTATQIKLKDAMMIHESRELTSLEKQVSQLWKTVLGSDEDYSYDQSFFDVGGNSLYIADLTESISTEFCIEIDIHVLFENSTLEEQAILIQNEQKNGNKRSKNVVLLRKGTSSDKNCVFIHAGSGEVAIYLPFCEHFKEEYNIYAIRYDKSNLPLYPEIHSFKILAQKYNELLSFLPSVEYLGGWCIGGAIGYEMLVQHPRKEAKLVLINSLPPNSNKNSKTMFEYNEELCFLKNINSSIEDVDSGQVNDLWNQVLEVAKKNKSLFLHLKDVIPGELRRLIPLFDEINDAETLIKYVNLFRGFEESRYLYEQDKVLENQTFYFNALLEPVKEHPNWELLLENIEYIGIEYNHVDIVKNEGIEKIARYLNEFY